MSTTYKLCKRLIALGRTEGLQEKIDVFYAMGRLTEEEYKDLTEMLNPKTPEKTTEEVPVEKVPTKEKTK